MNITKNKFKHNPIQEVVNVELDATNQRLGRLASKIAVLLQGKERADYAPNLSGNTVVTVNNIDKLSITDTKKETKEYQNFSGYPGGLKVQKMNAILAKKGYSEVMRSAVRGMLPKNKLQDVRMHNLVITEVNAEDK